MTGDESRLHTCTRRRVLVGAGGAAMVAAAGFPVHAALPRATERVPGHTVAPSGYAYEGALLLASGDALLLDGGSALRLG